MNRSGIPGGSQDGEGNLLSLTLPLMVCPNLDSLLQMLATFSLVSVPYFMKLTIQVNVQKVCL